MSKSYKEIPDNYSSFSQYLIDNPTEVAKELSLRNCFFYDTCSFRFHSSLSESRDTLLNHLFKDIKTLVITRTVLMELTADSFQLSDEYVSFLQEINSKGIKILLLNEEWIEQAIRRACSLSVEELNSQLGYIANKLRKSFPVINRIYNHYGQDFLTSTSNLRYSDFFSYARSNKESEDSLAEVLIMICIVLLKQIITQTKTNILISDDRKSLPVVRIVWEYININYGNPNNLQLTTPRIAHEIFLKNPSVPKLHIEELIGCTSHNENIKVILFKETSFIKPEEISYKKEELIDFIYADKLVRILY